MKFLPTNSGLIWDNTFYPLVLMVLFGGIGICLLISYLKGKVGTGGMAGSAVTCVAAVICFFVALGIAASQGGHRDDVNRALNLKEKYAIEAYLKTENYDRDKKKVDVAVNGQRYTFWLYEDPQSFEPLLVSDEKVSSYDISRLKK